MVFVLDSPPLCMKSNKEGSRLVIGCVDGSIRFYNKTTSEEQFDEVWRFQTESNIRGVDLDETHGRVYAVTKNRSLLVFDLETGERTQCILKCHSTIPSAICTLPPTDLKNQQLATTDEAGEVKTWNFDNEGDPMIRKWNQQKEDINDMEQKVRSEVIHSELFGVCSTEKSVYVRGEDGDVEVFNLNQYENLLERIESGFEMGAQGFVQLRTELEPTGQGCNEMRLQSKRLHGNENSEDDEVDSVTISADKSTFKMLSKNRIIVMRYRPNNKLTRMFLKKSTLESLFKNLFKRVYLKDELREMEKTLASVLRKYDKLEQLLEGMSTAEEEETEILIAEFVNNRCEKDFTCGQNHTSESLIVLANLFMKLEEFRLSSELLCCSASIAISNFVINHKLKVTLESHYETRRFLMVFSEKLSNRFSIFQMYHDSFFVNDRYADDITYDTIMLKDFNQQLQEFPLTEEQKKQLESENFK